MKFYYFILPLFLITPIVHSQNTDFHKKQIILVLDNWHEAAANADFNTYFNLMTEDAVFIGTDASENWNKKDFQTYAKPHFDKGKAWKFKSVQRNIYFSEDKKTAWFDELLDTQMKICRGSGVLVYTNKEWKIAHYVLSITIPNEFTKEIIELKSGTDNLLLEQLKK